MKQTLIIKIVLILAALVAVWLIIRKLFGDDIKQAEYQGDAKLKDFDSSPYASVTVQSATIEEINGMINEANPGFFDDFKTLAENLPTVEYNGYIRLVAQTGATGAEFMAIMDMLKPDFKEWFALCNDTSLQCAKVVTDALVQLEIVGYQKTCIQTTFVDNVTETSEAVTTVKNTGKRALYGAVRKNTSEKTTTERKEVAHCMVPHCTQEAVDPSAYVARLETKREILVAGYTPYKQMFASEPDAELYRIALQNAKTATA
jgi:hypothetical protein